MGAEFYQDYISVIRHPINFLMIKEKMIKTYYSSQYEFIEDMNLVFDNCMEYNQRNSKVYKSAQKMKKKFKLMLKEQNLN